MKNRGKSRRNRGDWETSVNLWGGSSAAFYNLAAGAQINQTIIGLVPAAAPPGVVPVGRLVVHELDINVDIINAGSAGGICAYGIGVYRATYDNASTQFSQQSPLAPVDATRDNWQWLEASALVAPAVLSIVQHGIHYHKRLVVNASLGQGEALVFVLQNDNFSQATLNYQYFIRYLVSRVI